MKKWYVRNWCSTETQLPSDINGTVNQDDSWNDEYKERQRVPSREPQNGRGAPYRAHGYIEVRCPSQEYMWERIHLERLLM